MQLRTASDVASKDLLRWLRSKLIWGLMFGAPLMIAGLLYFAFGGFGRGEAEPGLPSTRLCIANLDTLPATTAGFAGGQALVKYLQQDELSSVLTVTLAADEAGARQKVGSGDADVALIIPVTFSDSAAQALESSSLVLYYDPTLYIAPGIVRGLLNRFLDGLVGGRFAGEVVIEQMAACGLQPEAEQLQEAAATYASWVQSMDLGPSADRNALLTFVSPPQQTAQANQLAELAGRILAGQFVFFSFFTAASAAQNILTEEEERTLARLFTTPTRRSTILAGKFLGGGLLTLGQVVVLVLLSRAVFGIRWGQPVSVAVVVLAQVAVSTSFGLLLVSFVKTSQQAGAVFGGVLTVLGMVGGLFTVGAGSMPGFFGTVAMFTPQGWALRAWKMALQSAGLRDLAQPVLVLLAIGTVCFVAGTYSFRRRLS